MNEVVLFEFGMDHPIKTSFLRKIFSIELRKGLLHIRIPLIYAVLDLTPKHLGFHCTIYMIVTPPINGLGLPKTYPA